MQKKNKILAVRSFELIKCVTVALLCFPIILFDLSLSFNLSCPSNKYNEGTTKNANLLMIITKVPFYIMNKVDMQK